MAVKIYVSLPVNDLEVTKRFFLELGYSFLTKFTDHNTACMVVGDDIRVLFVTKRFFSTFVKTEVCDTTTHNETLTALRLENREAVDAMIAKALAAGATEPQSVQDFGFMYERSFRDLDGHIWGYFWIDEEAATQGSTREGVL